MTTTLPEDEGMGLSLSTIRAMRANEYRGPTLSALDQFVLCPAAWALPQRHEETEGMARGTARHKYLEELGATGCVERALAAIPPEHRAECAALDLDGLDLSGEREISIAIDVANITARRLVVAAPRAYVDITPTEVPGTLDLMRLRDGVVDMPDWKGPRPCNPGARESLQMVVGALGACLLLGADEADVTHVHFRDPDQLSDDGRGRWPDGPHRLDLYADLVPAAGRVLDALHRWHAAQAVISAGGTPRFTVGAHCAHCRAVASCPEVSREALALVPTDGALSPAAIDLRALVAGDPDRALAACRRIDHAVKQVKAILADEARTRGPFHDEGKPWGWHPKKGDVINHAAGFEYLRERFGVDVAVGAVKMELTKTAIGAVAKAHAPPRGGAALKREIESEMRARGIMTPKTGETCGSFAGEDDGEE